MIITLCVGIFGAIIGGVPFGIFFAVGFLSETIFFIAHIITDITAVNAGPAFLLLRGRAHIVAVRTIFYAGIADIFAAYGR